MPSLPIRMPQLGESAAEAVVQNWLIEPGDPVRRDQDLIEVETEKSVLTVTAPADGVLLSHEVGPGASCQVGGVLGHLEVTGDDPALRDLATHAEEDERPAPPDRRPGAPAREKHDAGLPVPAKASGHGYLSPRLRARMSEYGLRKTDLGAVRGTGRAGRVSVQDLERYLEEVEAHDSNQASPMRIAVADSMVRSWTRPLATIATEARMEPLMEHRRTVAGRPSATVYAIAALARALRADDRAACRLVGERLIHPRSIDIAFAVEIDDGVRTPVIVDVPSLGIAELEARYEEVIDAARDARRSSTVLGLPSTATVSNYGTFGITWATPIPLPEQSLILGVGAVRNTPAWDPRERRWGRARTSELTLTFDHRGADGGAAGRLLKAIREMLENPEKLG